MKKICSLLLVIGLAVVSSYAQESRAEKEREIALSPKKSLEIFTAIQTLRGKSTESSDAGAVYTLGNYKSGATITCVGPTEANAQNAKANCSITVYRK